MTFLLRTLKCCECVEILRLFGPSRWNGFFDKESWRALCDVVQHTSLEVLDVVWCGLGESEAEELATSLTNNTTLRVLWLYVNKIGEGVLALSDVLQRNETMRWLYLNWNGISESTCHRVKCELKHIPFLDFDYDYDW